MADYSALGSILIVDDNENMIRVIESALEDEPLMFSSTTRARETLDLLQRNDFDLVLLDAKMPDLNGFEVCRRIKQDERWRNVKVIMVSASSSPDDKLHAFEAGADDYITKPFRPRELQARVRVMINLRHAEKELVTRNTQLIELIHFSELINLCLDVRSSAEEVVRSAASLTKADLVELFQWEPEKQGSRLLAHHWPENVSGLPGFVGDTKAVLESVQSRYGTSNPPVVTNYSNSEIELFGVPRNLVHELAFVPLRLGSQQIGNLLVGLTDPNQHFSRQNLDILISLANQAAISLENSRLYSELYRSEEQYRLIAEKASDLIVSMRPDGTVGYVNERVRSLLGYDPLEVIGRNFKQLLVEDSQITFNTILQRLTTLESKEVFNLSPYELTAFSREGRSINLEFNFGASYGTSGVSGFQAIGRDVSLRKQMEEQERMRVLGTLASGVAHDFNNVLANVLGHAQLLEQETVDEEVRHTLQIIEHAAMDGAETVRRIQEFTGQRTVQKLDLIDVNQAINSIIELSRPRWRDDAQSKGMNIEIICDLQQLVPKVNGKAAELREVLVNLLNNAIDAFPHEGGRITFRTKLEREKVVIQVSDNGHGMPPEVRRHIFEPFYTTKGVRGTGLGLSVAYGIISRYKGTITCDSTPGIGTTFTIRLPAVITKTETSKPATTRRSSGTTYQGHILVIDDEANIRSILNRALSQVGFEVEMAAGGAEALDLIEQRFKDNNPFQLILSDLGMPNMSGWDVARTVAERWNTLDVVLVTGWGDQLEQAKMQENHVRYTLAKPFNIQDVVGLVASLIPQSLQK